MSAPSLTPTTNPSANKIHKVAILLFPSVDILDFAGPLEFLSRIPQSAHDAITDFQPVFSPYLIGTTPTINTGDVPMTAQTHALFSDALQKVEDYDVLVVPGGHPDVINALIKEGTWEGLEFIRKFAALPAREDDERIVLSVCTGALFLAAGGILAGLKATTHHMALEAMKQIDGSIEVQSSVEAIGEGEGKGRNKRRYVDGGRCKKGGARVVTAGGVTCGMDAALYIGQLKAGRAAAEVVARINEHDWARVE